MFDELLLSARNVAMGNGCRADYVIAAVGGVFLGLLPIGLFFLISLPF